MPSGDARTEATHALIRHLTGRQRAGEEHVWLTDDARRDLMKLRDQNRHAPRPQPTDRPPASKSEHPRAKAATNSTSQSFARIRENLDQQSAAPQRRETAAPRTAETLGQRDIPAATATGNTKRERLDSLIAQASGCKRCHEIGTFRDTMVFAVGDPDSAIMFVGEAPGAEEEVQGEPFVGPAGQLLTKIIGATGLDRSRVYISNICKYRPKLPNQTSNNRKPTTEEMEVCLPYITAEVDIVRPKVIVALGGTALEGLLGTAMSVARAREDVHDFRGIPLIVTYHPSYLLRNTAVSERRKVWEDMMRAMEIVGLPISEKQRGFFRGR